jgi:hypothetical protein
MSLLVHGIKQKVDLIEVDRMVVTRNRAIQEGGKIE